MTEKKTIKRTREMTLFCKDDFKKNGDNSENVACSPNIDSVIAKMIAINGNNFDPIKLMDACKYKDNIKTNSCE